MHYTLFHGDNREQLKHLADNSIDSIVCDPPYELGFMGKRWDSTGIAYDLTVWTECLRVLKPGGHLIAFGGTRTYHRMTVAIEDAGFEIRDCIMWLYGSGFPKSLAIDKAIDKQRHDRAQVYQVTAWIREARDNAGLSNGDIDKAFGFHGMAGHWTSSASQPSVPTLEQIPPLLALFGMTLDDVPEDIRTLIWTLNGNAGDPGKAWYQREVVTEKRSDMFGEYEVEDIRTMTNTKESRIGMPLQKNTKHQITLTAPATDLAKQWHGWGTALKPAVEPAVLARKPLIGTVADNVTAWGVGGINVDGCRVGLSDGESAPSGSGKRDSVGGVSYNLKDWIAPNGGNGGNTTPASGRWPANVILDESAGEALDAQSGWSRSSATPRHNGNFKSFSKGHETAHTTHGHSDSGGASRFFYTAKASKAEREAGLEGMEIKNNMRVNAPRENEEEKHATHRANHHPTVKPIALMRYLVRLVTPKDGTVLDPFMGSGSTGCAAMCEGMNFVGIELSEEYLEIARRRIEYWQSQNPMGL